MSKLNCFVKDCQNEAKYQFDFSVGDVLDSHTFFGSCEEHLGEANERAREKMTEIVEKLKVELDQLKVELERRCQCERIARYFGQRGGRKCLNESC